MNTRLYVGNLDFKVTEIDLTKIFQIFGKVKSSRIILDTVTGKSRGFGFVEMEQNSDARDAIGELNGKDLLGRIVTVKLAKGRSKINRRVSPHRAF